MSRYMAGTTRSRLLGLEMKTMEFRHGRGNVPCDAISFGAAEYQTRVKRGRRLKARKISA
jgi:hypothetical protein